MTTDNTTIDAEAVEPPEAENKSKRRQRTVTVPANLIVSEPNVPQETPASLVRLAVQQNFDIDKLEKLLQLQRDWMKDEARRAFFAALSKFQSEIPPITKCDKIDAGRAGKRRFASLGTINEAIRPWLYANGLSFRFSQTQRPEGISVTCIVSHADGHSEETTLTAGADMTAGKNPIQSVGSTITYLERYTLVAALGLTTVDDDDDGGAMQPELTPEQRRQSAMEIARQAAGQAGAVPEQAPAAPQSAAQPAPATPQMLTPQQTTEMMGLLRKLFATGAAAGDWLMQQAATGDPRTLTESQATDVLIRLNQMAAAAATPPHPGPSPDVANMPANQQPVQQAVQPPVRQPVQPPVQQPQGTPQTPQMAADEQRLLIRDLTVRAYTKDAPQRQADWLQSLGVASAADVPYSQAEDRIAYLRRVVGDVPF